MPKKTKKQKIIADYRRKIKLFTASSESPFIKPVANKIVIPVKVEERAEERVEETIIRKYFFQDLKKSLVLIGLIIALEIIFYVASINNYFGLG